MSLTDRFYDALEYIKPVLMDPTGMGIALSGANFEAMSDYNRHNRN